MQRRKPFSAKQKKAQLQQKRAIKRGDISPPPSKQENRHRKTSKRPSTSVPSHIAVAVRRLESSFVKLPKEFLEKTKQLSASLPLRRPIPPDVACLEDPVIAVSGDTSEPHVLPLTCPKRPKWRYDMTKEMVEKNEEALFGKWLDQTGETINEWWNAELVRATPDEEQYGNQMQQVMPHAPTSFERNLEVWRQLWRVTEISQIVLILLDSRCPLLHYPQSLSAYLSNPYIARRTRTVLVLTKVDIAGPVRAEAWTSFLRQRHPGLRVVQVESFVEKPTGEGSGKRKKYEPHLPSAFRQTLVETLKETHAEFLQPPERLKDAPDKMAKWRPSVKRDIDWNAVLHAQGGQVGTAVGGAIAPRPADPPPEGIPEDSEEDEEQEQEQDERPEPEFLTIGLIGQPNVGKSSLLNALFGTTKVRASRTPGKTKHFQTLFWTSEVRLVDCPGLVMPNFLPMETQVLSGILPISRVSAIPLCIYHAARLLPLERIFELTHPALKEEFVQDKRTWREPRADNNKSQNKRQWTAMDILTAFALKKGWVTAKAGRPDVNRAGNYILRAVAEGKIRWGFWPPGTEPSLIEEHHGEGNGIWIPHTEGWHTETEPAESDYEEELEEGPEDEGSSDPEEERQIAPDSDMESSEDETPAVVSTSTGRFGALMQNAEEDEEDEL